MTSPIKAKNWTFYADPGHGWLKVARKDIAAAGVAEAITSFSYQRGDYVYLEEDCDMSTFLSAVNKAGYDWSEIKDRIKTQHTNKTSKIRGYERYRK